MGQRIDDTFHLHGVEIIIIKTDRKQQRRNDNYCLLQESRDTPDKPEGMDRGVVSKLCFKLV